jgi:hypothetical protein
MLNVDARGASSVLLIGGILHSLVGNLVDCICRIHHLVQSGEWPHIALLFEEGISSLNVFASGREVLMVPWFQDRVLSPD